MGVRGGPGPVMMHDGEGDRMITIGQETAHLEIHQYFLNLVAEFPDLSELSPVLPDFALKFRPH
jgi:hypothetical protein